MSKRILFETSAFSDFTEWVISVISYQLSVPLMKLLLLPVNTIISNKRILDIIFFCAE
ncbi:hypothetical protein [Okeania sp. KiyG1]|uniref:hypothetical protein n=1 Tax=Okeania sp. KiyG1 TaxID=2720165 RepID=UPI0019216EC1|nr:hypothetical protein [Okeania sp. KiyG1]